MVVILEELEMEAMEVEWQVEMGDAVGEMAVVVGEGAVVVVDAEEQGAVVEGAVGEDVGEEGAVEDELFK